MVAGLRGMITLLTVGWFCLTGSCQRPCLKLYGTIIDWSTQSLIREARLVVQMETKEIVFNTIIMNGTYQIQLPCGVALLRVEAKGYRTITLPIELPASATGQEAFFVPLPLMPMDTQSIDRPYFQAEQSHVEFSETPVDGPKQSTRIFRVVDAFTEKPLAASLCLFYTQTARKDCKSLSVKTPDYAVLFTQPDIVAFEVTAPGYQSYKGNLLLERLDGLTRPYLIRLIRSITLLTIITPKSDNTYWLINEQRRIALTTTDARHHYAVAPAGTYQLGVSEAKGQVLPLDSITLKEGLNYRSVFPERPIMTQKTVPAFSGNLSDELPALQRLYFDQSDYHLRTASGEMLKTLATWLGQHPDCQVLVVGHTDNVGNADRNLTLSEFRAKVVVNYLINRGVSAGQLRWEGKGSRAPAASNDTEEHRQLNRRVEIQLMDPSTEKP